MAHSLFEGLGVSGLDGQQTALAVQSLLDSQAVTDLPQDDGDIFQCGRCKRQYTSLPEFMAHKEKCVPKTVRPSSSVTTLPQLTNKQSVVGSSAIYSGSLGTATAVYSGSVGNNTAVYSDSLGQGLVLSEEEFTTLTTLDNPNLNLQAQQINITFQGSNPVLSQISGTPQQNTVVSTSPSYNSTVASLSAANTAFTNTLPNTPLHSEQEVEISDVVVTEEHINESVSTPTVGDATVSPTQDVTPTNTLVAQPHAIIEGTSLEGLTLGTLTQGGLQLQQIQLAGNQAQPIVLAQGLTSPANLLHGISIVKPSQPKQTTVIKKEGYAILQSQPQELQYITTQPADIQQTTQKVKSKVKVEKMGGTTDEAGKKKLRCTYCDKPFSKNFDLQQHIRSHTGEKPFQCIVCGRAFAQKSNVKKHMQTHKVWPKASNTLPDDPIVLLNGKDNTTPEQDIVEKTVVTASPTDSSSDGTPNKGSSLSMMIDSSYNCQYCPQKFNNYFHLKSHMVAHKSEQVYKCIHEKCSSTFKDLDLYLEHTKTHDTDMEYNCHICSKKFPALYDLGVHQYSHSLYPNQGSKPGPKYYKCSLCGNKYTSTTALKHHLDSTDHKYPCPKCGKIFQCERALRRHITTHNESLEYVCEICRKGFKTQQYLKLHQQNHQKETPWQCDICGAAFNRKDKLKRHKIIHEPNKKYKCPFRNHTGCDRAFNRADKLKAHIISHSGIKPFKCRYCSKTFSRRPHLNEHIRVHEGNYRFYCQKCKKGFNRRNLLRMHNCRGMSNRDEEKTESESETREKTVKKVVYNKKIKRKPGRPRKMVIINADEALDKVKRPVGRPRKPILPHPDKDTGTPIIITNPISSTSQTDGAANTDSTAVVTLPLEDYNGVVGEEGSSGENVVHVQLVTDPQGPMLAQDLEQQHSVTTLKHEASAQGISFVGSLTQEQLQEIFLAGNTHNVKLMETNNGDTFVIDEGSQQILTRFGSQGDDSTVTAVGLYPANNEPVITPTTEEDNSIVTENTVLSTQVLANDGENTVLSTEVLDNDRNISTVQTDNNDIATTETSSDNLQNTEQLNGYTGQEELAEYTEQGELTEYTGQQQLTQYVEEEQLSEYTERQQLTEYSQQQLPDVSTQLQYEEESLEEVYKKNQDLYKP